MRLWRELGRSSVFWSGSGRVQARRRRRSFAVHEGAGVGVQAHLPRIEGENGGEGVVAGMR